MGYQCTIVYLLLIILLLAEIVEKLIFQPNMIGIIFIR